MSEEKLWHTCNLFVIAEAILFVLIQTLPPPTNYIDYASVILAALFFFTFAEKSTSYAFTQIGLLFTVVADYFLVIDNAQNKLAGVLCFLCVQIAYFLRIAFEERNSIVLKIHLVTRFILPIPVLIATCFVLGDKTDLLALVSMLYFTNLFLNIVFSIAGSKKSRLLTFGLILFILCDIFVGLGQMEMYFNITEGSFVYMVLHSNFNIVWFFYVPSQTLLALSLMPDD